MSSASNPNIFQICRKLCVLVPAVLSFFCCARAGGAEPAKVLEGSVVLVSTLPAIDKLAYADCDYVVVLAVNTAGAGENRLAVVVPGIRKYKNVGSSNLFRVGKKYRLTLKDASALPEERRRIQISDDNENFDAISVSGGCQRNRAIFRHFRDAGPQSQNRRGPIDRHRPG